MRLPALVAALLMALPVAAQTTATTTSGDWTATFSDPTTRYGHNVLGDLPEWGKLCLTGPTGTQCIELPQTSVFEDITPRLADVDQDGTPEAIVIESDARRGAQLSIYDPTDTGLTKIATPYIGTSYRWLAPAGIADLDGDGHIELAYVDRPHLAKTLRIWRLKDGDLSEVARLRGVTNHRIGHPYITGGLKTCGDQPEMILVDAGWSEILSVKLLARRPLVTPIGSYTDRASVEAAMTCQ